MDILTKLPKELAMMILTYLEPCDLCVAQQVSRAWSKLCNTSPELRNSRKSYVIERRQSFKSLRENLLHNATPSHKRALMNLPLLYTNSVAMPTSSSSAKRQPLGSIQKVAQGKALSPYQVSSGASSKQDAVSPRTPVESASEQENILTPHHLEVKVMPAAPRKETKAKVLQRGESQKRLRRLLRF